MDFLIGLALGVLVGLILKLVWLHVVRPLIIKRGERRRAAEWRAHWQTWR